VKSTELDVSANDNGTESMEEPASKKSRRSSTSNAEVIAAKYALIEAGSRLFSKSTATTLVEKLQYTIEDTADVYDAGETLTHKDRVKIFHALVTYLHSYAGLSQNHMHCLSVHELCNVTGQYHNGVEWIVIEVEPRAGKYYKFDLF
jgi:hypothetical protein